MSLGAPVLRASSINVGSGSSTTIASTFGLSTLQDSYVIFAVGITSGAVRSVSTPPSGLSLLFSGAQLGSTTAGGLFVYGGIVARGASAPSLILSGANSNRWQVAEYLNVDPDNPIGTATPSVDVVTQSTGSAGSIGSHAQATGLPDELVVGIFGGRGQPTGIAAAGSGMSVEQAVTNTSSATLGSFSGAYAQPATPTPGCSWSANGLGSTVLFFDSVVLRPRQRAGWGLGAL